MYTCISVYLSVYLSVEVYMQYRYRTVPSPPRFPKYKNIRKARRKLCTTYATRCMAPFQIHVFFISTTSSLSRGEFVIRVGYPAFTPRIPHPIKLRSFFFGFPPNCMTALLTPSPLCPQRAFSRGCGSTPTTSSSRRTLCVALAPPEFPSAPGLQATTSPPFSAPPCVRRKCARRCWTPSCPSLLPPSPLILMAPVGLLAVLLRMISVVLE